MCLAVKRNLEAACHCSHREESTSNYSKSKGSKEEMKAQTSRAEKIKQNALFVLQVCSNVYVYITINIMVKIIESIA